MRAGEGFEPGPQCVGRVGRTHQKKARGMNAKFQKSGGENFALFEGGKILADPEKIFLLRFMLQTSLQHKCSKTVRGAAIRLARIDLMQHAEPQATPQAGIDFGMPERGESLTMRSCKPRSFEGEFQSSQLFGMA